MFPKFRNKENLKTNFEILYEVIPSAVYTVNKDRIIMSWNKRAQEITGYTPEDVIGKKCTFFTQEPCYTFCCLFEGDGECFKREVNMKTKDGEIITVLKNSKLFNNEKGNKTGEQILGIEIFEDISSSKDLEGELKIKIKDLEDFNKIVVGRELKMIELKEKIKNLNIELEELKNEKRGFYENNKME